MYTVKVFLSVNREMLQDSGLCISLQEEELNNNNIDCILEEQNVSSTVCPLLLLCTTVWSALATWW